jgi:hypothetical protein
MALVGRAKSKTENLTTDTAFALIVKKIETKLLPPFQKINKIKALMCFFKV